MPGQGYVHPQLAFAITTPETAELLEEGDDRVLFAIAGEGPERPAIVTVQVQPIDPEWDAETFATEALAAQAAVLGRLRVIDRETTRVDDQPAVRVLLQRREDDRVVVLEEWRLAQSGRGWTVSALCPVGSYWALAPLITATAASFALPDAVVPAPPRAAFDDGVLTLSAGELTALTDLFEGRAIADEHALARLEEAGVVEGGRPVADVAAMLATVTAATVKLTVQRPDPDVMAWCHEQRAVLLLRLGGDARQLAAVERDRLPGILADLLGLGPRPTAPDRPPLQTTVAELTEAFAATQREIAQPATAADVIAGRRGHWRIDAQLPGGRAMLEALDVPGGWWLVRPDGSEVTLEPTTATALWAHLTEIAAAR